MKIPSSWLGSRGKGATCKGKEWVSLSPRQELTLLTAQFFRSLSLFYLTIGGKKIMYLIIGRINLMIPYKFKLNLWTTKRKLYGYYVKRKL